MMGKKALAVILTVISIFLCGMLKTDTIYAEEVPRIILSSYEIEDGNFAVGENTTIKMHITNTSSKINVKNILLSYKAEDNLIYSAEEGSNQIFIGNINAGKTADVELKLKVASDTEKESVPITFNLSYTNASDNKELSNEFYVYIPINSIKFVSNINLATSTTVGSSTYLNVNFSNECYLDITNVRVSVVGKIKDDSDEPKDILADQKENTKVIEMGDVSAGNTGYVEDTIIFTEAGQQNVTVAFTYTDENGEEHYEIGGEYSVNVMARAVNDKNNNIKGTGATLLWLICILIGVVGVAAFVAYVLYKRKKGEINLEIIKDYIDGVRVRFK